MKIKHALLISVLAFGSTSYVFADEEHDHKHAKPSTGMMQNQQGMMGGMKPEQMQKMMAMKQAHMQKMEQRMAKMEAMMQELIDLQKANNSH